MHIDFDNIIQRTIPIENFGLKWRFTQEEYEKLPEEDLNKLKPLDSDAAKFLWNYIADSNLHADFPFKKEYFQKIEHIKILDGNESEVKEWLYQREFAMDKFVFLSWNQTNAMIVPWRILIKYFDSFYYGNSDDLTVFEQSLDWALLFFHEDEIYFGKN